MLLSFLYFILRILFGAVPTGKGEHAKDVEILVLRHQVKVWGAFIPITALTCEFADPMIAAPRCQAKGWRR